MRSSDDYPISQTEDLSNVTYLYLFLTHLTYTILPPVREVGKVPFCPLG